MTTKVTLRSSSVPHFDLEENMNDQAYTKVNQYYMHDQTVPIENNDYNNKIFPIKQPPTPLYNNNKQKLQQQQQAKWKLTRQLKQNNPPTILSDSNPLNTIKMNKPDINSNCNSNDSNQNGDAIMKNTINDQPSLTSYIDNDNFIIQQNQKQQQQQKQKRHPSTTSSSSASLAEHQHLNDRLKEKLEHTNRELEQYKEENNQLKFELKTLQLFIENSNNNNMNLHPYDHLWKEYAHIMNGKKRYLNKPSWTPTINDSNNHNNLQQPLYSYFYPSLNSHNTFYGQSMSAPPNSHLPPPHLHHLHHHQSQINNNNNNNNSNDNNTSFTYENELKEKKDKKKKKSKGNRPRSRSVPHKLSRSEEIYPYYDSTALMANPIHPPPLPIHHHHQQQTISSMLHHPSTNTAPTSVPYVQRPLFFPPPHPHPPPPPYPFLNRHPYFINDNEDEEENESDSMNEDYMEDDDDNPFFDFSEDNMNPYNRNKYNSSFYYQDMNQRINGASQSLLYQQKQQQQMHQNQQIYHHQHSNFLPHNSNTMLNPNFHFLNRPSIRHPYPYQQHNNNNIKNNGYSHENIDTDNNNNNNNSNINNNNANVNTNTNTNINTNINNNDSNNNNNIPSVPLPDYLPNVYSQQQNMYYR